MLRHRPTTPTPATAALAITLALMAAACGNTDDGSAVRDTGGGSVEVIEDGETSADASASASGSASGSASSPSAEEPATASTGDSGYEYATNVDAHRLLVADVCEIKELKEADPIDFAAMGAIYRDGGSSVNSDGSVRSLAGFTTATDRLHGFDTFYGTPTPLDDFVTSALDGTGSFEGASDAVRAQGVEKGVQNQILVAWVVHELRSALAKATEGDFDPSEGAVHNWDEAWAFYAGSEPGCAPWATANSRAENFGTLGSDGETARTNEAILAAMIDGRDALLAEDAATAEAAATEVVRNVVITYSQAAIRYATLIPDDIAAGDTEAAAEHQVEGYAFWRVIEPIVVPAGADGDAVNAVYAVGADQAPVGGGDEVRAALEPAWEALGITADDIGTLQ